MIVYPNAPPGVTVAGFATLRSCSTAFCVTVVAALAVLFTVVVSTLALLTVAVFVYVPAATFAGTSATIVSVTRCPTLRLSRSHVTPLLHTAPVVPPATLAETKLNWLGSASTTCTAVAADGPVLVTTTV